MTGVAGSIPPIDHCMVRRCRLASCRSGDGGPRRGYGTVATWGGGLSVADISRMSSGAAPVPLVLWLDEKWNWCTRDVNGRRVLTAYKIVDGEQVGHRIRL